MDVHPTGACISEKVSAGGSGQLTMFSDAQRMSKTSLGKALSLLSVCEKSSH